MTLPNGDATERGVVVEVARLRPGLVDHPVGEPVEVEQVDPDVGGGGGGGEHAGHEAPRRAHLLDLVRCPQLDHHARPPTGHAFWRVRRFRRGGWWRSGPKRGMRFRAMRAGLGTVAAHDSASGPAGLGGECLGQAGMVVDGVVPLRRDPERPAAGNGEHGHLDRPDRSRSVPVSGSGRPGARSRSAPGSGSVAIAPSMASGTGGSIPRAAVRT